MMNSFTPQKNPGGSPQPIFLSKITKTYAEVVQDKSASRSERSASDQPERVTMYERADKLKNAGTRSQKQHAHSNSFVPLTIHVPCIVRDEIERRAKNTGGKKPLSLSEVGRPIFTRGLQADVDMQYGALLEPIIRRAIQRETRSLRSFLMLILSRIAFDIGQTRAMTTNILARQPGLTQQDLAAIRTKSGETASDNITRITPQLSEIMQSLKELLGETEEGREASA